MTNMRRLFVFLLTALVAVENQVDAQRGGLGEIEIQQDLKQNYSRYLAKKGSGKGYRYISSSSSGKRSIYRHHRPAREPSKEAVTPSSPTKPRGDKKTHSGDSVKRNKHDKDLDQKVKSSSDNDKAESDIKIPSAKDQNKRKKHRGGQSKRQMEKLAKRGNSGSSSNKSGGGKGKGKGTGKHSGDHKGSGDGKGNGDEEGEEDDDIYEEDDDVTPPEDGCRSSVATTLVDIVPEVTTMNPTRCCDYDGPIGVYVTHALPSSETDSGFEPFWDTIYTQIETTSEQSDTCFVMTGYEPSSRSVSDILTDVTVLVSSLSNVAAMMVSDPTSEQQLINEVRFITKDPLLPSIGVFNAGYNNIVIESLVSGEQQIPYVGVTNDADFGIQAAKFSKDALDGREAKPLCFNGRTELEFIGERCVAFYSELGADSVRPIIGAFCAEDSPIEDLFGVIVDAEANVVFSTLNCCSVVSEAVTMARSMGQSIVAVGCQDADTTGGQIDYVTAQPILLQGYTPASWVNFPVQQAQSGERGKQFFPSLDSIVKTDIFTIPIQ